MKEYPLEYIIVYIYMYIVCPCQFSFYQNLEHGDWSNQGELGIEGGGRSRHARFSSMIAIG